MVNVQGFVKLGCRLLSSAVTCIIAIFSLLGSAFAASGMEEEKLTFGLWSCPLYASLPLGTEAGMTNGSQHSSFPQILSAAAWKESSHCLSSEAASKESLLGLWSQVKAFPGPTLK